jgi:hypothetical protein
VAPRFIFPLTGAGVSSRGDPFFDLHREMNRLFENASRGTSGGSLRMDIH